MKKVAICLLIVLVSVFFIGCGTENVLNIIGGSTTYDIPERDVSGDILLKIPSDILYRQTHDITLRTYMITSTFAMSEDLIFMPDVCGENIYCFDYSGALVKTIKRPRIVGNTAGFDASEVGQPNAAAQMSYVDGYIYLRVFAEIAPTWGRISVVRIDPHTEEIVTFIEQHETYREPFFDEILGIRTDRGSGYKMPLWKARDYYWTSAVDIRRWVEWENGARLGKTEYLRIFYEARDPLTNTVVPDVPQITFFGSLLNSPWTATQAPQHHQIVIRNSASGRFAHDADKGILYRGVSKADFSGLWVSAYADVNGSHLFNVLIDAETVMEYTRSDTNQKGIADNADYHYEIEFARGALYVGNVLTDAHLTMTGFMLKCYR